jgi:hypothetical protein
MSKMPRVMRDSGAMRGDGMQLGANGVTNVTFNWLKAETGSAYLIVLREARIMQCFDDIR